MAGLSLSGMNPLSSISIGNMSTLASILIIGGILVLHYYSQYKTSNLRMDAFCKFQGYEGKVTLPEGDYPYVCIKVINGTIVTKEVEDINGYIGFKQSEESKAP